MNAPFPYLVTTTRGEILVANGAATELFEQPPQVLVGRPLSAFNAKRRGAVQRLMNAAVRSERPVTAPLHLRVRGRDRTTRATVTRHAGGRTDSAVLAWAFTPLTATADPHIDELMGRAREAGEGAVPVTPERGDDTELTDAIEQAVDGEDPGPVIAAVVQMSETPLADLPERSLGRVARAAVTALGADGGSVTELSLPSIGATDDDVRDADRVQYERQQGPCLSAVTEQRLQYTADIAADERWPETGKAILAESGFRTVLAAPLIWDAKVLGVLNVYARRADAFAASQQDVATVLAGPAAAIVYHGQVVRKAREQAENMRRAMGSRAVIEQAKGILMVKRGLTLAQAFDTLVKYSQDHNRKLHDVASEIVASASPGSR